jgi:two-component system, NarL family, response regulator YdfI
VTRVLIVAASPLVRAGLQNLLGSIRVDVVGSIASIEAFSDQLLDVESDAILIHSADGQHDRILEDLSSSEASHDYAVLLLTDHAPPNFASDAIRSGVRAVLPADISAEQLKTSLDAAIAGFVLIHPSDVSSLFSTPTPASAPLAELPEPLTRREREVLQMLASGLGNKEIAARLAISDHTAKFHVASILGKLGAATRTEAVSLGIRRGLVLL